GLGFDLNVGLPPGSNNAAGDYWGLDTAGGYVYTAWTDTRNGNQDIYTSRGTRSNVSPTPAPTTNATATLTATSTGTSTRITTTATSTRTATPTNTRTVTGTAIST